MERLGYTFRAMGSVHRTVALVLLCLPVAFASGQSDLTLDRTELEQAGELDLDFENYQGPVERIETRREIRGIGEYLGERIAADAPADYFSRYTVYRIVGDENETLRAADVFELSPQARVDHIDNFRRIIAGYLERAWDYQDSDAEFLARMITIYNAVHRGEMSFFGERYRSAVVEALDPERVGLALSYREWPGQTQLVVPIRTDRDPGDLDAVSADPLMDEDVMAELRGRRDLGVEDRKEIIDFVERVIEERTEAIIEERQEIDEERREIEERREEVEVELDAVVEEGGDEPADRDEVPASPGPARPARDRPEIERDLDELDEREAELERREEDLDDDIQEVEELEERLEEIYEETADDQAALIEGDVPAARTTFPVRRDGTYEITVFDIDALTAVGEQTIPTARPDYPRYQGAILAVDSRAASLVMVDDQSLELLAEGDTPVYNGSDIEVIGSAILAIVEIDGSFFVGEFDSRLVLQRRSRESVLADSEIQGFADGVLVQNENGRLISLDREQFR